VVCALAEVIAIDRTMIAAAKTRTAENPKNVLGIVTSLELLFVTF
jgi:hypothetical protein